MKDLDPSLTAGNSLHNPLPPIEQLPEWNLLIGEDVQATPDAAAQERPDIAAEAKRTRLSDECLREAYSGAQHKLSRLSAEDFAELQAFTRQAIGNETTFDAVRYFMDVHDVGKNDRVRQAVGAGEHVDHDEVFTMLVCDPEHEEARRALLPTFDALTPTGQDLIRRASQSRLNYPQILQGEAPAATLEGIHNESDPQVRDIDILKSIFDIAGAAGHVNSDASITMTSPTWQRMRNLNAALQNPDISTAKERNDAFLDMEIQRLGGMSEVRSQVELEELRALARLECHLRVGTSDGFAGLREVFGRQPETVKAILTAELNRDGINDRATLPYYGPKALQELTKKYGEFGLTYYAHILQEAHIADKAARAAGQTGVVMAELGEVVKGIITGELDPRRTPLRFVERDGVLVPHTVETEATSLESLPQFEQGEALQGKRMLVVGMGGGSDGIQAAMLGKLLESKYGSSTAAVVSVRNEERRVSGTGVNIGSATKEITPATEAVGDWRFLEKIPLEGEKPTPVFILNSIEPDVVRGDISALVAATGAEVVIGLDTGGDSLYRTEHAGFSATSQIETTPDQDHQVLEGLADFATQNKGVKVLSAVVAPGVDSPPYAREVLDEMEATQLPLTDTDVQSVLRQYAEWRMDGSGNQEGRYGKTPLAWLQALKGNMGVQVLDLPASNVTSERNPWRAFTYISPAMRMVVLADLEKQVGATQY
ncbi:MAG TPA: hypothetical protein VJR27_05575 [Candidatus Saccharimonadales bacterium]|nr:hypothetical protein [Candidatus Saccharimonadales bacterium]